MEAWYVDAAHAEDPTMPVERALARAGTVLGLAIAVGALVSGGLVAWAPAGGTSPLLLPFGLAIAVNVVHLVLTVVLVRETRPVTPGSRLRRVAGSVRSVPRTVADGVGLLRTAPVLRSLVLVEVFWSVAMIAFETLNPVRLAELVGGEERAGVIIGPVSAVSWGLFAAGAALGGLASRRIGVAWTALLARVLNGAFVVGMGLAAGPVGLIAAFLATYTLHGAAGPMHNTLLHRQAGPAQPGHGAVDELDGRRRVAPASACWLLGPLAEHTSTATAIVVAGAFSILGAASLPAGPPPGAGAARERSSSSRPRPDAQPSAREPRRRSASAAYSRLLVPQYRISQAASLLGVSDDTVRRWVDSGRLRTSDGGGVATIDGAELAALAQEIARAPELGAPTRESARNRFTGLVTRVVKDTVMAQVDLQCGPFRVVSLMSAEAAEDLQLEPGVLAVASVKSTHVVVEIPETP